MNKKMREILADVEAKNTEAKSAIEANEFDKADELMNECDAKMKEYETVKRVYDMEKASAVPTDEKVVEVVEAKKTESVDSVKAFADAARKGFKGMNEGTPADGGYTVPNDIQTRIQEYRESKASLLDLVTVENVNTNKGARTFKKRAQQTGFTKVGEGGAITKTSTPQFEIMNYEIEKYAGYFPVTNELLADSDANIVNVLVEWIGDESRVTANKLILAEINDSFTAIDVENLDGIKKALNVTLGAAYKPTSVIVTNDDGLQYLDTLKDNDGDYLLSASPADPMQLVLSAGASAVPVKVIPNADLPTTEVKGSGDTVTGHKVPFIVGDIAEAVVYFDRQQMTIMSSNIATIGELNAYENDLTIYRAIEREDVVTRDDKAIVNGYIEIPVAGE